MSNRYREGLVDPISLVALGFLVVSLFVGAAVVKNRGFNFDIREKAFETECDPGDTTPCTINGCPGTKTCGSNYKFGPYGEIPCRDKPGDNCPAPTPIRTPTPSCDTSDCYDDCICKGNTPSECRAACPTPTPTPTLTPTPPTPQCRADGICLGPGEACCGKASYFDSVCSVTETRCGIKSTPTPTPTSTQTPTPTPTPYCSRFNQDDCLYGCEPTSTGGKCRTTPSITPTPAVAITEEVVSTTPSFCTSPDGRAGTCRPGTLCTGDYESAGLAGCTPETATRIIAAAPVCCVAKAPSAYCSPQMVRDCTFGCLPTTTGGKCTVEGEITPTPAPDEYAIAAFTSPGSSIGEQLQADLNYILFSDTSSVGTRLWAAADIVTLGGLTNYGQTYADINQQQSGSSYLEKSFASEGLGASARLGATLVGEFGGGAVALDALAGGTATLEAYTGIQAVVQTTLSNAPSWVVPALRYGTVIAGNYGVYQGILACQQDPASDLCAATIVSGQLGLLDDLARETGNLADDVVTSARNLVNDYNSLSNLSAVSSTELPFYGEQTLSVADDLRPNDDVLTLFHGSDRPLNIRSDYTAVTGAQEAREGSLTLGTALYATPDESLASQYASFRATMYKTGSGYLNTISVDPSARTLQLATEQPGINRGIPQPISEAWIRYVQNKYVAPGHNIPFVEQALASQVDDYRVYLSTLPSEPGIRDLLGTTPSFRGYSPSPPWVDDWKEFMVDQGIDILTAWEGTDWRSGAGVSFAIYNYDAVQVIDQLIIQP